MRDDCLFRTPNDLEAGCDGTLWALANNWVGVLRRGATTSATDDGADIVVMRGNMRELAAVRTASWDQRCN